jgi:type I restriction enzyme S subunit
MSDVPEGYKMSEVGVIPVEWEVKKLGVVADVKTGPFGSSLHERDYVNDGTPIITVEHLGEQGVVHKNLPMVSDFDRKRLNAYALQPDDIVFSRVGSVDRNSLIKEKENGWLFSGRLLRIRLNTKFILKNIEVAIPPTIEEQQAIASALSDVDALITALEQLITKKRNIKQGAMQQLIIGKKRLPGFGGEWEMKKLGEIAEIKTGKKNNEDKVTEGKYLFFVRSQQVERIDTYSFDGEAILMPGEGNIGSIIHYINGKFDYFKNLNSILRRSPNNKP